MQQRPPQTPQEAPERTCRALARSLADPDWSAPPTSTASEVDAACAALEAHGLLPAVAQRLRATTTWAALAASTRALLEGSARLTAARELASRAALLDALDALGHAGIDALVIKGEALAHQVYPAPALRERSDVDLWVRACDFERAGRALLALGFATRTGASGEWLQPERSYVRGIVPGAIPLDLHRRLFAQASLAAALEFDDALAQAQSIAAMRVPCPAHALLIAALHRVAHHGDDDGRLLWFWDVHMLCTRFPEAVADAAALAHASGTAALLGDTLARTVVLFGTTVNGALVAALLARRAQERSARLLAPMSQTRRWWFDLFSLPDWSARARFAAETFAPDAGYMRERFGGGPLGWLYVRRALAGVARALRWK